MADIGRDDWIGLYEALERPLYNVVYRVVWDAAEAQDIVQEAFLRCWRRRAAVYADGARSLLYRTALNLALNRRRQVRLRRLVGLEAADEALSVDAAAEGGLSRPLRAALDSLPTRLKQVLLLTELAGMTYQEVAATLRIRPGTVGSRRNRALEILRAKLAPAPEHDGGPNARS